MTFETNFKRWLRRAALAAIPLASLSGCGSGDCDQPDFTGPGLVIDGGVTLPDGSHPRAACAPYCDSYDYDDRVCFKRESDSCLVSDGGVLCHIHWDYCAPSPCGRMPAGATQPACEGDLVGRELAKMAWLEGASVFAFRQLAKELRAHDAPELLVRRAEMAERDEVRHARSMTALARRYGAAVPEVQVEEIGVRTLREIAIENAAEGCVRETLGAVVAMVQAETAADARVRRAMRSIAADEADHAALGWAVDAWARSRKIVPAVLDESRAAAFARFARSAPAPREVAVALGIPAPAAIVSALRT